MNREERIKRNKIMRKRRRRFKRIFLLLIIFFALFFGLKKAGVFNVRDIMVKGPKGVPVNEIIKQSGFAKGRNYFDTTKKSRIASIEKIPNIKNVRISFSPSRVVTISVDRRIPKAQIAGKNKYFVIDDEFKVIEISKKKINNLMTVEGLKTDKFALGKETLPEENSQRKLLEKMFSDENIFRTVETLNVSKYESTFYTDDDIKVDLGTYTDLDYKFKMLNLILKDIEETGKEVSAIEMEKGPDPIVIGKTENDSSKEDKKEDEKDSDEENHKSRKSSGSKDNKKESSKKKSRENENK